MNILLFIHIIISLLLIAAILLQKTGSDSLSGLSGGSGMGIMTSKSAANFLTQVIVVLATLFLINAIILANLSSRKTSIIDNLPVQDRTLPIAK